MIGEKWFNEWLETIHEEWHTYQVQTGERISWFYPLMIWDAIHFSSINKVSTPETILAYWGKSKLSIENQSKECIDYIHSLIQQD